MKKLTAKLICACAAAALCLLSACAKDGADTASNAPVTEPASVSESSAVPQDTAAADASAQDSEPEPYVTEVNGHTDGERFEKTVMIEGMDETVQCEFAISPAAGAALEYDCEYFVRSDGRDNITLRSAYDDKDKPINYMVISASSDTLEGAVSKCGQYLTENFASFAKDNEEIEGLGSCVSLRSEGNALDAEKMQADSIVTIYIVPADDGFRIVEMHYTVESAEGFGARMMEIMRSMTVIPAGLPSE